jgi:hypothetical protein
MSEGTDSHFEGLGSLINFIGATVPARARFIGETVLSATLSSITFGLVCGQMGIMAGLGPIAPMLCGSWMGYSLGIWRRWTESKRTARQYAEHYPQLMLYALQREMHIVVPSQVQQDAKLHEWLFEGGLHRTTQGILAAQACRTSVEEIQQRGREKLVEQYTNGTDDD